MSRPRKIYLGQEKFALVDSDLFDNLIKYKWEVERKRRSWYAYTMITGPRRVFKLYMHRLIARTPANMITHHINRNSLDNQRANLKNMLRSDHKTEHINNPIKVIAS